MSKEYKNVPIFMIGLGGIGSRVVNNVFGKLKNSQTENVVEALVFDTSTTDLSELTNIPEECRIQTSTDKTVAWTLEQDKTAEDWFPNTPTISKRKMIDGAGQVRAISRLALRSAIKDNKLKSVIEVRERLNKVGTETSERGLRVVVVSSMMGGTGSGMFLQVPLYIRDLFKDSGMDLEIEGVFILPDILKGKISKVEEDRVNANAYAAMKELNAINMSISQLGPAVDLEYKPDQRDATGKYRDITVKNWPYDFCYFYDKEDSNGHVLGGFDDYTAMVEENLYLQLYGPLSDRLANHNINLIEEQEFEKGLNIFGGIGTGKLVYPYEDIVNYCVYNVLTESMNNQLLKLDNIYKTSLNKYSQERAAGKPCKEPNREEIYIDNFEELVKNNDFFFSKIFETIAETNDNDEITTNADRLVNEINSCACKLADDFSDLEEKCKLGKKFTDTPDQQLKTRVVNNQDALVEYREVLETKAEARAETAAKTKFGITAENGISIINDFIKHNDEYVNSVGIRYILYKTHSKLKNEHSEIGKEIDELKEKINRKEEKAFENNKGKKVSASEKTDEVMKGKGLFGKNIKTFKSDYEKAARTHLNTLHEYCEKLLKYYYGGTILELLEKLIREYENMFESLSRKKDDLNKEINKLAEKHESSLGTTTLYVLAGKDEKEQIWQSIPNTVKSDILTGTLPEEMHKALFNIFKDKENNPGVKQGVSYNELFDKLIFSGCKKNLLESNKGSLREKIDLNILQALEREAELTGSADNIDSHILSRLRELQKRVSPWIPPTNEDSDFCIWGVSNKSRNISEDEKDSPRLKELIATLKSGNITKDEDNVLNPREIIYLLSRSGLMVSNFPKFAAGKANYADGTYYVSYNKVLENVRDGRAHTPHIDKNWTDSLMDINPEVRNEQKQQVNEAFIIGLGAQILRVDRDDYDAEKMYFVYQFKNSPSASFITHQGNAINHKFATLYDAMKKNPVLVKNICDTFNKYLQELRENLSVDQDPLDTEFVKKLCNIKLVGYNRVKNILDVIFEYLQSLGKGGDCTELMNALFRVVEEVADVFSYESSELSKKYQKKLYKAIIESSAEIKTVPEGTNQYNKVFGTVKNKAEG